MASRKKAAGKARRAAKEEATAAKEREDWRQDLVSFTAQTLFKDHFKEREETKCRHGISECCDKQLYLEFLLTFWLDSGTEESLPSRITAGIEATSVKYAAVWNDVAKMEEVISVCLSLGTQNILNGRDDAAAEYASFAHYFYQHVAVYLKKTRSEIKWHRIRDLSCDPHTLVSFYRKRIPCSCLDEIYEEVKSIPKTGLCDYPNCDRKVERKKMKACTGCRKMTWYCSPACRKAHWPEHKHCCAAIRKGTEQH